MPELSRLLQSMMHKPSPIRQIMKMASQKNIVNMGLDPEEVISYGGGWVGHHAPEEFREAYREIGESREAFHDSGKYSPTLGFPECRQAIAAMERELFGVELEEDNIIVGQSSTQLTHDVLVTVANPGDAILLLDPTYANYMGQIDMALAGSRLLRMPVLDPDTWEYIPEPQDTLDGFVELVEKERPRLVIVPSPDNPSSQVMPQEMVAAMMEVCRERDMLMVIDHAYKTQVFGERPDYFSWSPNDYPHLVTIHSNSKWCRGLGRRLGWIEAHPHIVDGMERTQQCSILCPDTLHQMAMTAYLERSLADGSLRDYIEKSRRAYHRAAQVTVTEIRHHLDMPHLTPQGGLYTLMKVGEDGDAFVKRVLQNTGVLFIPGRGFGDTLAQGVRISYGPHVENTEVIREGFERVAAYLG
ncbi:MAG: pyridoxal phosphate-dependent aminotransferase [Thermoplasmatota archaeon]